MCDGKMREKYNDGCIYLRPMTSADTEDIVRWRNSESVRKNFIYQQMFTRQSHESWLHNVVEKGLAVQMIICDAATDQGLGSVYIRDIDQQHHKGEYGIFIGEEGARGRGIGTRAAKLMIAYGFQELSLHKIFLRVFADNVQAFRSYEKSGFEKEAYLKEEVCIDGIYRDMIWMAILNKEN